MSAGWGNIALVLLFVKVLFWVNGLSAGEFAVRGGARGAGGKVRYAHMQNYEGSGEQEALVNDAGSYYIRATKPPVHIE
jgi:hypothetical protein